MGLFFSCLSKPITEKYSTDETNNKLNCGTSTMQGWREDQEDAHNCILDYDTDTSFFAVYDGHGGVEVAKYCSDYLPNFLKELEDYKKGNFEKALEDAFLQFDATITSQETNMKLREYRKEAHKNRVKQDAKEFGYDYVEEEDEEHIKNLCEEATMPIEKVIAKYKAQRFANNATITNKDDTLPNNTKTEECSTSNVPESSGEVVSSTSNVISSKSDHSILDDDQNPVSSGSNSKASNETESSKRKKELKVDSPDSSGDTKEECTPSDEVDREPVGDQNGVKVESTQNCESTKSDVTSSSTTIKTPEENGEVMKKGKGKALTKTKGVHQKLEPKLRRTAQQIYNSLLSMQDCSEEESEDEKDKTFEGQNDDSSDEAESENDEDEDEEAEDEEEEEEEDVDDAADVEDNSDESSVDEDSEFHNIGMNAGCTAVVALLKGNDLYVANAGDSRCVVCRNGQAIEMSFDHKPEDEPEHSRIIKAGGNVYDGRVNSGLNLSRAIGDFDYKKNKELSDREQMITALPDVKTLKIKPGEDEFMILACDGIWNSMSSQEVVDYVWTRIIEGREKLSQICEELFDHCLAPNVYGDGAGCDNMTAIIVRFPSLSLKRPSFEPDEPEHNKRSKIEEPQVSTET